MTDVLNPIVVDAIKLACKQNGQSEDVARKISTWFDEGLARDLEAEEMLQWSRLVVNLITLKD